MIKMLMYRLARSRLHGLAGRFRSAFFCVTGVKVQDVLISDMQWLIYQARSCWNCIYFVLYVWVLYFVWFISEYCCTSFFSVSFPFFFCQLNRFSEPSDLSSSFWKYWRMTNLWLSPLTTKFLNFSFLIMFFFFFTHILLSYTQACLQNVTLYLFYHLRPAINKK